MKVSGFTIVRNAVQYNYPVLEAIRSILPICDEFIVNVGDSTDGSLALIRTLKEKKIKILETKWDKTQQPDMLTHQTNLALKECSGDWAFYVQADEVVHEADLPKLRRLMHKYLHEKSVDVFRFKWLHFYGSFWRYRIDAGWFQKQDRIVRNDGTIESTTDAFTFCRKDGQPIRRQQTSCFIYHYGWVQSQETMAQRRINAENIGFVTLNDEQRNGNFEFEDFSRFPIYFGTHPAVMKDRIAAHSISRKDLGEINRQWWWYPPKIFNIRYKSGRRIKEEVSQNER
ncbi:MAG TPA: glycosyltransferase [Candidatus Omnitrophota bacterium]|nr:glycosyltransferase [Candidatus Omnitrophota bacterium]